MSLNLCIDFILFPLYIHATFWNEDITANFAGLVAKGRPTLGAWMLFHAEWATNIKRSRSPFFCEKKHYKQILKLKKKHSHEQVKKCSQFFRVLVLLHGFFLTMQRRWVWIQGAIFRCKTTFSIYRKKSDKKNPQTPPTTVPDLTDELVPWFCPMPPQYPTPQKTAWYWHIVRVFFQIGLIIR